MKLTDSLMNTVAFAQAKDAELAWVDGVIHTAAAGDDTGGGGDMLPVLDVFPQTEASAILVPP